MFDRKNIPDENKARSIEVHDCKTSPIIASLKEITKEKCKYRGAIKNNSGFVWSATECHKASVAVVAEIEKCLKR